MPTKKVSTLTAASGGNLSTASEVPILDDAGALVRGTTVQLRTAMAAISALTGDVTASGPGSVAATIASGAVTSGKLAASAVTTATIADDAVTYAKLQNVSASPRLLGRTTASAGNAEELTVTANLALSGGTLDIAASVLASIQAPTVLGSDQTNGSTVFANCTGLALTVAANTNYWFEFLLLWQSGTGTNDGLKAAVTGPSSPTALLYLTEIQNGTTAGTDMIGQEWGSGNDATTTGQATVAVADTSYWARLSGWLLNGANSGSVQLRFASTTGNRTIKIKAGSFGRLQPL